MSRIFPAGFLLLATISSCLPLTVRAQGPGRSARISRWTPEVRVDALFAPTLGFQFGAGATTAVGNYLRVGAIAAAGAGEEGFSARTDVFGRFHPDPFRERRRALYAGGGLSVRYDRDEEWRTYLLVLLGVDGGIRNGIAPSLELGLGGGARLGVVLRRGYEDRR